MSTKAQQRENRQLVFKKAMRLIFLRFHVDVLRKKIESAKHFLMRAGLLSTSTVEFLLRSDSIFGQLYSFSNFFSVWRSNPTGLVGFAMARTYFDPKVTLEANFKPLRSHDDLLT